MAYDNNSSKEKSRFAWGHQSFPKLGLTKKTFSYSINDRLDLLLNSFKSGMALFNTPLVGHNDDLESLIIILLNGGGDFIIQKNPII